MLKMIAWGTAEEWDFFSKWFELEIVKGNMHIECIVLNRENFFYELQGIEVIPIEGLLTREYDYLIDMNQNNRESVLRILELLRIPRNKVIPAHVFGMPAFDLKRWSQVQRSRVSIIANNCWGGYTYNSLGLEFQSPFINMFLEAEDYLRLLENLEYYLAQPLHYIKEGYEVNLKRNYPIVGLDDVTLYFNHYIDFETAVETWNRRKEKINYDNLLVEMIIDAKEDLEKFCELPYKHKIGFTKVPCEIEDVIYFPVMENGYVQEKYQGNFWNFINHMAMAATDECRWYDVLKLLNHEKDYRRARMV
ncbi:MAG: DUF1919 domain-containing protein [Roseburia sp.]|nr:DUF1919 domain-containing protein [Roseburia sp.]MCM1278441.1 DUF1919 domain-containing protein [Robinsoniella sp.]